MLQLAAVLCFEFGAAPSWDGWLAPALFGIALSIIPCAAAGLSRVYSVQSGPRGCVTCFIGATFLTAATLVLEYLVFVVYIGLRI